MFALNIIGTWDGADGDERGISWARGTYATVEPWIDGVYVNFLGAEGDDRVRSAYRPDVYARLAETKHRYDPDNVLHRNQNIAPAAG